ncbi:hypothetical protein [Pseudarthrobacter sp. YAF2]|uniref:hypothetical protein n=1 Tax=Pseudarthrobacter sp. YAF2 TaxID=3233078 RepID=UPI003F981C33
MEDRAEDKTGSTTGSTQDSGTSVTDPSSRRPDRTAHRRGGRTPAAETGLAVLLGIAAALVGLTPWLITGARLPLQNLWANDALPPDMPLTFLPLSQYRGTTIVALLTVGASVAGLALRVWKPARRGLATAGALCGVLLVHVGATVQSFSALNDGLAPGPSSALYFAGLLGGTIAAIAAGVLALLMLAARSRAAAALGVGFMAVPFASWLAAATTFAAGADAVPASISVAWRWLPAVLVGLALAWCGFRPLVRLLVWAADVALLWLVPALFTSVNYVLGTRVYLGDFQEMAVLSRQILAATLGPAGGAGPSVLVALGIGIAGAFLLSVRERKNLRAAHRRANTEDDGGGAA